MLQDPDSPERRVGLLSTPQPLPHRQRRLACLAALQGGQAGEQSSGERGAQVSAGAGHAEPENRNRVFTAEYARFLATADKPAG